MIKGNHGNNKRKVKFKKGKFLNSKIRADHMRKLILLSSVNGGVKVYHLAGG